MADNEHKQILKELLNPISGKVEKAQYVSKEYVLFPDGTIIDDADEVKKLEARTKKN